jgi:hypothetical protein
MKLTPNFDSTEFDIHEPWPQTAAAIANRQQLAELDQWLRDLAGVAGFITSAYRSPERNAEVNGSETSQHMQAQATDVVFYLVPLRTLAARVLEAVSAGEAPAFGQLIFYGDRGHVHCSLPTLGSRNGEIRYSLGPNADGTRSYPKLTDANQLPQLSSTQKKAGFRLPAHCACSCWPAGGSHANKKE